MTQARLLLRSSVRTSLMKYMLLRGSVLGGCGAILLFCGAFMPPKQLSLFGLPLFMASIFFMTWGWLPYRRLRRMENIPDTLSLEGEGPLQYLVRRKLRSSIPQEEILDCVYLERGRHYGIGLKLKNPKIFRKNTPFPEVDLFFPYFSQRSFEILKTQLASYRLPYEKR